MGCCLSNPELKPKRFIHEIESEDVSLLDLCAKYNSEINENKTDLLKKLGAAQVSCREFRSYYSKLDLRFSRKSFKPVPTSQEDYECKICYFIFNNFNEKPVLLPCGHSFCLKCLQKDYEMCGKTVCPLHNEVFHENPDSMPIDNSLINLVDGARSNIYCEHHSMIVSRYCFKDKQLLCHDCIYDHMSHDVCDLNDPKVSQVLKLHKTLTQNYLKSIQNHLNVIKGIEVDAKTHEKDLKNNLKSFIGCIKTTQEGLIKKLNEETENYTNEMSGFSSKIQETSMHFSLETAFDHLNHEVQKAQEFMRNIDHTSVTELLDKLKDEDHLNQNILNPDLSPWEEISTQLKHFPESNKLVFSLSLSNLKSIKI